MTAPSRILDPAAARAEKAERELAAARATLAEHVEENITLHARCGDLEATLRLSLSEQGRIGTEKHKAEARCAELEARVTEFGDIARSAREALGKLERERDRAEAERDELTARLRAMGAFDQSNQAARKKALTDG